MAQGGYAPIVVTSSHYCNSQPSVISIEERWFSFSGWDSDVTDENGNTVFQIRGVLLSLRERILVKDPGGTTVITMQERIRTLHQRWRVYRGESTADGALLFSLRRSSMLQFKTTLEVFLATSSDDKVCDFKVKDRFFRRSCTVYLGNSDIILAKMEKGEVSISPNVDQAFVISLIIVLKAINKAFRSAAFTLVGMPISP